MTLIAELFGLDGKIAVVTGAGAGLGREICALLARAGATVVATDVDLDTADRTAKDLSSEGLRALSHLADVTDEASVVELFRYIEEEAGGIDILVNNAGIYPNCRIEDMSVDDWTRVHDINLRGVFLCSREAVRLMRAQERGGRVINISSIASLHPALTGNTHYTASKAGVNMFTKALALEVAPDGITVNAVLPGGVMSETRKERMADAPNWEGPATDSSRFLLGLGHPSKHAAPVVFLASPAASHITGQQIVVDGGFLIS